MLTDSQRAELGVLRRQYWLNLGVLRARQRVLTSTLKVDCELLALSALSACSLPAWLWTRSCRRVTARSAAGQSAGFAPNGSASRHICRMGWPPCLSKRGRVPGGRWQQLPSFWQASAQANPTQSLFILHRRMRCRCARRRNATSAAATSGPWAPQGRCAPRCVPSTPAC